MVEIEDVARRSMGITVYLSYFVQCCHGFPKYKGNIGARQPKIQHLPRNSTEQSHETTTPAPEAHAASDLCMVVDTVARDVVEKMRLHDWSSQWLEKPFVPTALVGPC